MCLIPDFHAGKKGYIVKIDRFSYLEPEQNSSHSLNLFFPRL